MLLLLVARFGIVKENNSPFNNYIMKKANYEIGYKVQITLALFLHSVVSDCQYVIMKIREKYYLSQVEKE